MGRRGDFSNPHQINSRACHSVGCARNLPRPQYHRIRNGERGDWNIGLLADIRTGMSEGLALLALNWLSERGMGRSRASTQSTQVASR